MTDQERVVLEHLGRAWRAFQLLPGNDVDKSSFAAALQTPMNMILAREGARTLATISKPPTEGAKP